MAVERNHRAQEPTSKIKSLDFFLSSIRDPYNPRHCGVCLDGAFRDCTDVTEPRVAVERIRIKPQKHNPELWNAIVKFLFIKRSKKQMERFLTRLTECTCRMDEQGDVQRYHERSLTMPRNYSPKAFEDRCYNNFQHELDKQRWIDTWRPFLLNLFISLSILVDRSSTVTSAKGVSTSWPIHSTDLAPYGPDALVQSILQWYQTIPDPLFIRLMGNILDVSRELVIPSLAKFKFTKTVVESTRQLLDRIIEDHLSGHNPERMQYLIYQFSWQVSDVMIYLGTCLFVVLHDDYIEALYQDYEMKAIQLSSLILYVSDAIRNCTADVTAADVNVNCLVTSANRLFTLYNMDRLPQRSFPVHPTIIEEKQASPDPPSRNMHQAALGVLRDLRFDMRCSAIGCMNSLQSAGNVFQRCVQCGIAAYCGRECQIKAWKSDEHPHRRICPILADMVKKAGGSVFFAGAGQIRHDGNLDSPRIMDTVELNWKNAHVDERDLVLFFEWVYAVRKARGSVGIDEKALSPGFTDYDAVIARLSSMKGAPKPVYLGAQASISESQSPSKPV